MQYLISDTTDATYNDGDAASPLCVLTADSTDGVVTDVSEADDGDGRAVDLVRGTLDLYPDSTFKEIVGLFGTAVAYKEIGS